MSGEKSAEEVFDPRCPEIKGVIQKCDLRRREIHLRVIARMHPAVESLLRYGDFR